MQYLVMTRDIGLVDWASKASLLRCEAERVRDLAALGVVRDIWFTERKDAVLLLECADAVLAREALESLPLVKAGLIAYELTELHPYTGFSRLDEPV